MVQMVQMVRPGPPGQPVQRALRVRLVLQVPQVLLAPPPTKRVGSWQAATRRPPERGPWPLQTAACSARVASMFSFSRRTAARAPFAPPHWECRLRIRHTVSRCFARRAPSLPTTIWWQPPSPARSAAPPGVAPRRVRRASTPVTRWNWCGPTARPSAVRPRQEPSPSRSVATSRSCWLPETRVRFAGLFDQHRPDAFDRVR